MNTTQTTVSQSMKSFQAVCCCAMICQNTQMMAFLAYSPTQISFKKQIACKK